MKYKDCFENKVKRAYPFVYELDDDVFIIGYRCFEKNTQNAKEFLVEYKNITEELIKKYNSGKISIYDVKEFITFIDKIKNYKNKLDDNSLIESKKFFNSIYGFEEKNNKLNLQYKKRNILLNLYDYLELNVKTDKKFNVYDYFERVGFKDIL